MADCSFIKFTEKTLGSVDELIADLDLVRRRGWAIDDEKSEKRKDARSFSPHASFLYLYVWTYFFLWKCSIP